MRRPAKPKPPLERDVATAIVEAFKLFGVTLERQNVGVGFYPEKDGGARRVQYGKAGAADWRGILPDGRAIEVEIKRPGKRPTAAQLDRIREINRAGGVAFWAVDAADVVRIMPHILARAWVVEDESRPGEFYVTDEGRSHER